MAPRFHDGDFVFCVSIKADHYRVGDVIVVNNTTFGTLIKRISVINDNGEFLLTGDSPYSSPSETLGWHSPQDCKGKVYCHIGKNRMRFRNL